MQGADKHRDVRLEAGVPLVGALLDLVGALDELQKRVLLMTCHYDSHATGRVLFTPDQVGGRLADGGERIYAHLRMVQRSFITSPQIGADVTQPGDNQTTNLDRCRR